MYFCSNTMHQGAAKACVERYPATHRNTPSTPAGSGGPKHIAAPIAACRKQNRPHLGHEHKRTACGENTFFFGTLLPNPSNKPPSQVSYRIATQNKKKVANSSLLSSSTSSLSLLILGVALGLLLPVLHQGPGVQVHLIPHLLRFVASRKASKTQ